MEKVQKNIKNQLRKKNDWIAFLFNRKLTKY